MRMAVFKTDRFRPFLPDERQVNPNVLGFELAAWLSESLARKNIATSYPSDEDWGWYLIFPDGEEEYQICCSGYAEDEREYEWRIFLSPIKRLLRKKPPEALAEELFDSVLDCLKEAGIAFSVEPA